MSAITVHFKTTTHSTATNSVCGDALTDLRKVEDTVKTTST